MALKRTDRTGSRCPRPALPPLAVNPPVVKCDIAIIFPPCIVLYPFASSQYLAVVHASPSQLGVEYNVNTSPISWLFGRIIYFA